jgi:hypothetical protein
MTVLTDTPESATRRLAGDSRRRARLLLLIVAVGFVVAQVVLFPIDAGLSWDEAVYVTQVTVGEPAVFFDEHRSRGMPLLVAPAAVFDPPVVVIRVWMILAQAALIFAAFASWVRTAGFTAPAAAIVFLGTWQTLYLSATLYPNFVAALAIVAVLGHLLAHLEEGRRGDLVAAALWIVVAALLRPSDAGLAGLGMAVGGLAIWRRQAVGPMLTIGLAGLVGVGVWFVEGLIRFGLLPWQLMTGAVERSTGGPSPNQLPLYLANLDGPLRCRGECRAAFLADPGWQPIPGRWVVWLLVLAAFTLLGLVLGQPRDRRRLIVLALAAVPLLWFYARSGSAVNTRYLLPVFGMVAVSAGTGVAVLLQRAMAGGVHAVAPVGVLMLITVLAVPWGLQQARMARAEMVASQQHRDRAEALGRILVERADGQPCAVASRYSYPQVQYWSGCLAVQLWTHDDGRLQGPIGSAHSKHDLAALAEQGWRIFALSKRQPPPSSPVHDWPSERIDSDILGRYEIWELPPGGSIPPTEGG